MKLIETALPGVVLIEPRVFEDARGYFLETWHQSRYAEAGLDLRFVQDNISYSRHGVLRGLHFQNPNPQGKLVYVLEGEVFDVAVDVRVGSPSFGRWVGVALSADNKRQMYIPPGYAHGFCVTGDHALFMYKCTDFYHPQAEAGIRWDDPDLAIAWPLANPQVGDKDRRAPALKDLPRERLPVFQSP
ncbi:MAG: dTDP-4-dehydrorhamnose 3,5-epimerase [Gammaproteobacteria bacterium]|nr:dTDP-4-dehydrorhamnose 3,5-epimerase [Gammaproteobacteria bacterium]